MTPSQPPRSSIPSTLPKRSSGAYYIAAIVGFLLMIVGLIWFKFSRKTEPTLPPVIQSVNAVATPPPPVFDIPAPPELDSGPEAAPSSTAKKPSSGGSSCGGPCTADAPTALRSALHAAGASARGCYERALRTNPMLQGRLTVAVRIGAGGNVCSASIAQDGLGAADVSSCVLGLFRARRFPSPTGGACADVQVPLSFKPKEEKK